MSPLFSRLMLRYQWWLVFLKRILLVKLGKLSFAQQNSADTKSRLNFSLGRNSLYGFLFS
jgi:hypothetical protein